MAESVTVKRVLALQGKLQACCCPNPLYKFKFNRERIVGGKRSQRVERSRIRER